MKIDLTGEVALVTAVAGAIGSSTAASLARLVRHVATTFGKQGIRCNAVSPGIVLTATNAQITSAAQRAIHEESHFTRLGRPEDVASLVTFLASDQAEFITGHAIPVDGASPRTFLRSDSSRKMFPALANASDIAETWS